MNWHCLAQDAAELLRYKGFKAPIKCLAGLFLSRKHGDEHGRCVLSSQWPDSTLDHPIHIRGSFSTTGDIKWW